MQKESVLEFKLNNSLYCFNTKIIKYVFELESYEKLEGISPVVVGVTKYNKEAIPLIDTLKLFSSDDQLKMQNNKSVIVICDDSGGSYGMIVDEIVHLEELEVAPLSANLNSEDLVINYYKKKDIIINEIVPLPLLKSHNIPSFSKYILDKKQIQHLNKKEYILFKIKKHFYAIEACFIDEVVEYEGELFKDQSNRFYGAIAIRNQAIRVANLDELDGDNLLIVKKNSSAFAIRANEVLDIEYFDTTTIEEIPKNKQKKISAYYNLNGTLVAIVNIDFFLTKKKDQKQNNSMQLDINLDKEAHLIFSINNKEFALDMNHIRQVIQVHDIAKTKSSALGVESQAVEFIAQWNRKAVDVIKLDKYLNLKTIDNGEVIMMEYNEKTRGILVDFIDDIYYAEPKDVTHSNTDQTLLDGALFKEDKIIPKLNLKKIFEVI